ncbi:hypothetical protein HKCCSP123_12915 [Rhodobacterales bacterium HKCCSP123]|nr:hypothetical protein [Rhodobacterales bacterium HKCCSP123]
MEWIFYLFFAVFGLVLIGIIISMVRARMRGESLTKGHNPGVGGTTGSRFNNNIDSSGGGGGGGGGSE